MAKRSQNVAELPSDKSSLRRIPANLDAISLPKEGQRWYQDTTVTPLRLRVSRRGLSWVFHGRIHGNPRRKPIGKYPRVDLEQARAIATRIASEGAPASVPLTFSQLRMAYYDSAEFKALADRTQKSYKWVLQTKHFAGLAPRKLRDITRLDLLALKDAIAASGRAYQNVLRPCQALFSWAVDRGHLDVSPAARLKLPTNEADARPYTDAELGQLVRAAGKVGEPWHTLYRLVAYTGQRPITWQAAKWDEINLKTGTLTVSRKRGRKSKLGRGWSVPLSRQAVELLRDLQKRQGRRRNEWLFGRALAVESKIRNAIARTAKLATPDNRGTMHRLRTTMLSKMNEWRVPTETQQRMAGHANPFEGARAHYIPAPPTPEMRELSEKYSEWVNYCELL